MPYTLSEGWISFTHKTAEIDIHSKLVFEIIKVLIYQMIQLLAQIIYPCQIDTVLGCYLYSF